MPRNSSFSVRDILDLPQMRPSSPESVVADKKSSAANGSAKDESAKNVAAILSDFNASGNDLTRIHSETQNGQFLCQKEYILSGRDEWLDGVVTTEQFVLVENANGAYF